MELIKDMSIANRYTDEQRPMTVEEWEIAKGMYQRAVKLLKDIVEVAETKDRILDKVRHLNCFAIRNQKDFENGSADYLDLEYSEDDTQSVEYVCVTVGLEYISTMFDVAIKHLDYEYECLTLKEKTTVIE